MFLTIHNQTRSTFLGDRIEVADSPWTRAKGLLGRRSLDEGGGLLITSCSSIHMFFMRFAIDVAFIDDDNKVVHAVHSIRPWRATWFYPKATAALELPAGTLKRTLTEEGDTLSVEIPDEGERPAAGTKSAPSGSEDGDGLHAEADAAQTPKKD